MVRTDAVSRRTLLGLGVAAFGAAIAFPPTLRSAPARRINLSPATRKLLASARAQIGMTIQYDPAYTVLPFPNGDVPRKRGVCTDVVIRAYRDALAIDLQSLVHADMTQAFGKYPTRWGLRAPDRNIDHRRVLNLQTYFERMNAVLNIPTKLSNWQPGDIATFMINDKLPHIGIVSDKSMGNGPMLIHNVGAGTQEEDVLGRYRITGRYRWELGNN